MPAHVMTSMVSPICSAAMQALPRRLQELDKIVSALQVRPQLALQRQSRRGSAEMDTRLPAAQATC